MHDNLIILAVKMSSIMKKKPSNSIRLDGVI